MLIPMSQRNKRLIIAMMITYFAHFFTFNLWHTTFNNFAVELFGVTGEQIGLLQSLREIPGFLVFSAFLLILLFSEIGTLGVSTIILGLGLIATALSQSYVALVLASILMSFGFHYFYTLNNAVVLMVVEPGQAAHTLGKFRSVGSFSNILAMGAVFLLVERIGYRPLYIGAGLFAIVFGAVSLFKRTKAGSLPEKRKIAFRKEYWLYYLLSFLEGSKKHISSTFTIFLIVSEFGVSARNISLLFMINAVVTIYTHQRLGRVVDRLGERKTLTIYYIFLILAYLGYAFINNVWIVCSILVLAQIGMGFSTAVDSYLQKIAAPEDITSNISFRTTIDHIAAIFIPLIGGVIWSRVGYPVTFLMGVGIVVCALVATQLLGRSLQKKAV